MRWASSSCGVCLIVPRRKAAAARHAPQKSSALSGLHRGAAIVGMTMVATSTTKRATRLHDAGCSRGGAKRALRPNSANCEAAGGSSRRLSVRMLGPRCAANALTAGVQTTRQISQAEPPVSLTTKSVFFCIAPSWQLWSTRIERKRVEGCNLSQCRGPRNRLHAPAHRGRARRHCRAHSSCTLNRARSRSLRSLARQKRPTCRSRHKRTGCRGSRGAMAACSTSGSPHCRSQRQTAATTPSLVHDS